MVAVVLKKLFLLYTNGLVTNGTVQRVILHCLNTPLDRYSLIRYALLKTGV